MNNKVNEFLNYFLNNSKNSLLISNNNVFWNNNISLFNLDKGKSVFFYEYFKSEDKEIYNLVIAELPFNLSLIKDSDFTYSISNSWSMLYKLLSRVNEYWLLIVWMEPNFWVIEKSKIFLKDLEKKGFFLQWLFESPENILAPQPTIAIFSKLNNNKNIFISSLNDSDNIQNIISNFSNKFSKSNLIEWDVLLLEEFKWFNNYKINSKIDLLQTQYKEFKKKHVTDDNIFIEINTTNTLFKEENNKEYIYIPKIWNLIVYNKLTDLDKKQHNYFQILVNNEEVKSEFLKNYFKSDIWQLTLKSLFSWTFIRKITKKELEDLMIPIPPIKTQEEIIISYKLLWSVSNVIIDLEKDLSLNPNNAKIIISKLTDTLKSLEELSVQDEVLNYIRQWESLTIEFKQTFSLDVKQWTNSKEIELSSLKSIAWFLNKEWWILLIWVEDNWSIYWIENEPLYKKSDDDYLKAFKDKLRDSIGIWNLDLVNYNIIEINSKKVLYVKCSKSKKEVYLFWKDFYVRSNPSTDKLEWRHLVEYIKSHFNN